MSVPRAVCHVTRVYIHGRRCFLGPGSWNVLTEIPQPRNSLEMTVFHPVEPFILRAETLLYASQVWEHPDGGDL